MSEAQQQAKSGQTKTTSDLAKLNEAKKLAEAQKARELERAEAERRRRQTEIKKTQIATKLRKTIGLPKPKTGPRTLTPPDKTIVDIADDLIKDANLPTIADQNKAVQELGISAARQKFKPKNLKEIKARLGLAIVEPIIGGAEEATLGISVKPGARPQTAQLRVLGALATPTAADLAAGFALSKLGATKIGRGIIKKIDRFLTDVGDPIFPKLTPKELDEIRQFEKIGLTDLRRTAEKQPQILKTVSEIAEFYEKNPASFTAGAAVIPEEVFIFKNIADDLNFDTGELIDFVNKNTDFFADGSILTAILGSLSKKDAVKVLEETTSLSKNQINNIVDKIRASDFIIPVTDEFITDQRESVILGGLQLIAPQQVVEVVPKRVQKQITEQIMETPEAIINEDVPVTEIKLKKREIEERQKINLRLFRGPKTMFRVTLFFTKSQSEVKTVETRSFVEAVNKAQRSRKTRKKQPLLIDIVKMT